MPFLEEKSHAGVLAQLVERLNGIEEVRGSIPLGSTYLIDSNLHRNKLPSRNSCRNMSDSVLGCPSRSPHGLASRIFRSILGSPVMMKTFPARWLHRNRGEM